MKKLLVRCAVVLLSACFIFSMVACTNDQTTSDNSKIKVVTTIFPLYDWVREIIGEDASAYDLTLLADNGIDMHSYQPSVEDIATISTCDMFIYVGGESDDWVTEVLSSATNENMIVINLLDLLGDSAKVEEIVEGMEHDHEGEEGHDHEAEEGHDHEGEETHDHEAEESLDEHIWLSLNNADIFCTYLAEQLGELKPESADLYKENASAYIEKLDVVDSEYQTVVDSAKYDTLVFGDRFPFRYLVDDYGLTYYAAFPGCSAESEASFETVTFLAGKINELGIGSILTIDGSDHSIAQTIIDSTQNKNQKILEIDSMQSVDQSDIDSGTSYLSIMEENLKVLEEALN